MQLSTFSGHFWCFLWHYLCIVFNYVLTIFPTGDPTVFGDFKPCEEIKNAIVESIETGLYHGYQPSVGREDARKAIAEYCAKFGMNVNEKVSFNIIIIFRLFFSLHFPLHFLLKIQVFSRLFGFSLSFFFLPLTV